MLYALVPADEGDDSAGSDVDGAAPADLDSAPPARPDRAAAPLATRADELLDGSNIRRHVPMTEEQVTRYIDEFIARWKRDSPDEPPPTREGVRAMMAARDDALKDVWTRYLPAIATKVAIGSFVGSTSPFILPDGTAPPLVVMASGLQDFAAKVMLGALTLADGGPHADLGVRMIEQSLIEWSSSGRLSARERVDIRDLATLDQENTTYAVGFSNTVFTWAYFHEAGHAHLGHLHSDSGNAHAEELAADRHGFECLLELMRHELEIRRAFEFGCQVDHAPLVILEMMDLAYRRVPGCDRRASATHPAPLRRRDQMARFAEGRTSEQGRRFYSYWIDLLRHVERQF